MFGRYHVPPLGKKKYTLFFKNAVWSSGFHGWEKIYTLTFDNTQSRVHVSRLSHLGEINILILKFLKTLSERSCGLQESHWRHPRSRLFITRTFKFKVDSPYIQLNFELCLLFGEEILSRNAQIIITR